MQVSRRRILLACSVVLTAGLICTLIFGYKVSASSQQINITTSPALLNLSIAPGTTKTETVQLINNSSQPIDINVKLLTFAPVGTSGEAQVINFPNNSPQASYVKFSPTSFTAQPKVWNKVQVTFSLPESANLGYYYAIVFNPVYRQANSTNSNVFHGSNSILTLVNTNSANENESVQLTSFTTTKHFYTYLPATFKVNVHNNGNIFLAPKGDIFISRTNGGSSLAAIPINSGSGNILPNSNRIFTVNWSDGFPVYTPVIKNNQPVVDKNGQPVNKLTWDFNKLSKFRFGRYYANLVLTYQKGNKTEIIKGNLDFWVIPWPILLLILAIVLIILLNLYIISRSIYRKIHNLKAKPNKQAKT